jgi:hypothetical protein
MKIPKFKSKSMEQHIAESVFPEPNTGCWLWAGTLSHTGYGQISLKGKSYRAHRLIYSHCTGRELTPDIYLCHTCDNKLCVNPSHLFEGSTDENMQDMVSKGRQCKGVKQHLSKLVEEDVLKIREMIKEGFSDSYISQFFPVDRTGIYSVRVGRTWSWLK